MGISCVRSLIFLYLGMGPWVALHGQQTLWPQTTHLDTLFQRFQKELTVAQQKGDTVHTVQKYLQMGQFYQGYGLYAEALGQYGSGLLLLGPKKDRLGSTLNSLIGEVYLERNDYAQAKGHLIRAISLAKELDHAQEIARARALLGQCYEKTGNYDQALAEQRESLALFQGLGDTTGTALAMEHIGSIYEDLGEYGKAADNFAQAHEIVSGTMAKEEAVVLNNIGDIYRKVGDHKNALVYTMKALQVAEQLPDRHQLKSAYKDLAKTYSLTGDYDQAYVALEQHVIFNEEWMTTQNTRQLNILAALYEAEQRKSRIALLEEQHKLNRANQKFLWIALVFVLLLGLAGYLMVDKKRKVKAKLLAYEKEMLKVALEKTEIEEKNLQREVQIKTTALSGYSLHLSQKNALLLQVSRTLKNLAERKQMDLTPRLKQLSLDITNDLEKEREWDHFQELFQEIHPDFVKRLLQESNHTLSSAELRLGMLLRLNFSSKEIASILQLTNDSVRVARHRLRKKLPIDQKQALGTFLMEL
jgi:tetratricopeptide (TPR) repeat protein